MLRSTLLLALAGLTFAADSVHFSNSKAAHPKGLPLLSGFTPRPQTLSMAGSCPAGKTSCDSSCMDEGAQCCNKGTGAYCDDGYHCQADGCCKDGKVCSGPPTGCTPGKELCGEYCVTKGECDSGGSGGSPGDSSGGSCLSFQETCGDGCMPKGMVCCDTGYCLRGQTCGSDGTCNSGSGSGGSPGGSSGGSCATYQEKCGDGCMPKGMVCCDTGYCLSGQVCRSDGTCGYRSSGGSSGGGSSGGSDDGDKSSFTQESPTLTSDSPSFTAPSIEPVPTVDDNKFSTFSSAAEPTGPRSGGDDNGDSGSSSSSDNGGSNSGSILVPSFFMGLVAMVPLFL
ncbi:hypothetical protein FMUND_12517 [Fusarium mundagurra]|uniref:GPI anchored protein n=1 Tax=Fusarium mundagurra TaxID=1567541 RepID=A0A8H5Y3T3_9HYPO|nr:hypothetical protein FMUND_12517 [Fusarium mundagurra]